VTRTGLTEWAVTIVMPSVTFAPLITPSAESPDKLTAIEICKNRCYGIIWTCEKYILVDNYQSVVTIC